MKRVRGRDPYRTAAEIAAEATQLERLLARVRVHRDHPREPIVRFPTDAPGCDRETAEIDALIVLGTGVFFVLLGLAAVVSMFYLRVPGPSP